MEREGFHPSRLHIGLMFVLAGCAQVEPPPGGPEDRAPPSVIRVAPPSDTIVAPFDGPVVFEFDERITQQGVTDAVVVSPRTSPVEIRGGRSGIRVSLREGWEAGMIYHVTLLTTVRDLFGNSLAEPYHLVFSTGPPIPESRLSGRVLDRITGRPVPTTRVEAIRVPDSLVYAAATDSIGEFVIDRFPAGEYQVRAFTDTDRDRSLDSYEARDSTFVTIAETEPVDVELRLLDPDSTAPVVTTAAADSLGVLLTFDDYLDPEQTIATDQVSIAPAGGTPVPITAASVVPEAQPAAGGAADPDAPPLPSRTIRVEIGADIVLQPDAEHTVTVQNIRNVNGLTGDSDTVFRTPAAPSPP